MREETRETQDDIIDLLEDEIGLNVTEINMTEFVRGDPTDDDAPVTGAEVSVTAYLSLDDVDDSRTNDFRYDP